MYNPPIVLLKVPIGQGVHASVSSHPYVPALHINFPEMAVSFPNLHTQETAPYPEVLSSVHDRQEVSPDKEYFPGVQLVHGTPALPAGHAPHVVFCPLYSPIAGTSIGPYGHSGSGSPAMQYPTMG